MSRGLNKMMIIGHLGRDPEMRYSPNGRPITTFSVATNRRFTLANGERRTETEWFNVITWGNLAEISHKYLKKGAQVYVEGRLQTHRWESTEGEKHVSIEIIANEMMMLGNRNNHNDEEELFDEAEFN